MKRFRSLWVLSTLLILVSCSKDSEEELAGNTSCNTTNMSFLANIKPILQSACFSCHGNGQSQNGINFDTYAGVKAVADNGKLVGAITHTAGFQPMPQGAPKLSDCDINKITSWVNAGASNN